MCRLVAYLGGSVLLERVLVKPENSLVSQSLHAKETRAAPTNGDGFGIGWYVPDLDSQPALFTSIFPAWNDRNLLHMAAKVQSPCFFGHVRAASVGGVNSYNCHPFVNGQWMWMHNGEVGDFMLIKRHLRHLLEDDLYNSIKGETDSEHTFALFMQLAKKKTFKTIQDVADNLIETLKMISKLIAQYGKGGASYFNLCLTDGTRTIATRYCSDKKIAPESMHYIIGYSQAEQPLKLKADPAEKPSFVLIASEKLTHWTHDWETVPANHLLMVDVDKKVKLQEIKL